MFCAMPNECIVRYTGDRPFFIAQVPDFGRVTFNAHVGFKKAVPEFAKDSILKQYPRFFEVCCDCNTADPVPEDKTVTVDFFLWRHDSFVAPAIRVKEPKAIVEKVSVRRSTVKPRKKPVVAKKKTPDKSKVEKQAIWKEKLEQLKAARRG